jgi:hypothetical protein
MRAAEPFGALVHVISPVIPTPDIGRRLNIRVFTTTVPADPTLTEIGRRAAIGRFRSHFAAGLTRPMVRRIIGWLRRLG